MRIKPSLCIFLMVNTNAIFTFCKPFFENFIIYRFVHHLLGYGKNQDTLLLKLNVFYLSLKYHNKHLKSNLQIRSAYVCNFLNAYLLRKVFFVHNKLLLLESNPFNILFLFHYKTINIYEKKFHSTLGILEKKL